MLGSIIRIQNHHPNLRRAWWLRGPTPSRRVSWQVTSFREQVTNLSRSFSFFPHTPRSLELQMFYFIISLTQIDSPPAPCSPPEQNKGRIRQLSSPQSPLSLSILTTRLRPVYFIKRLNEELCGVTLEIMRRCQRRARTKTDYGGRTFTINHKYLLIIQIDFSGSVRPLQIIILVNLTNCSAAQWSLALALSFMWVFNFLISAHNF